MTILEDLKSGRLVVVPPVSVKLTPCDCERGHNGIGVSGRECDCSPDHTAELVALVEGIERERDKAQRLVNQLSDDITFLRKRRGDLVRDRDAAEARALAAEADLAAACENHAHATIGWERERGLREAAEAERDALREALSNVAVLVKHADENFRSEDYGVAYPALAVAVETASRALTQEQPNVGE